MPTVIVTRPLEHVGIVRAVAMTRLGNAVLYRLALSSELPHRLSDDRKFLFRVEDLVALRAKLDRDKTGLTGS
jgi:hypothetical protein